MAAIVAHGRAVKTVGVLIFYVRAKFHIVCAASPSCNADVIVTPAIVELVRMVRITGIKRSNGTANPESRQAPTMFNRTSIVQTGNSYLFRRWNGLVRLIQCKSKGCPTKTTLD